MAWPPLARMKKGPAETDAPRNVPKSTSVSPNGDGDPRPVTGSPYGTGEVPYLRGRGFSMRAFANQIMLRSHLVQKEDQKRKPGEGVTGPSKPTNRGSAA